MESNSNKKLVNQFAEFNIEKDILLWSEKARDFGKDIGDSYVRLAEKMANNGKQRDCYGIVIKEDDKMTYYACLSLTDDESENSHKIPTKTLPAGKYLSLDLEDWNKNLDKIGPTFDKILLSGKVATSNPCIEYYESNTLLKCMVKID